MYSALELFQDKALNPLVRLVCQKYQKVRFID
jgi:hypothetical protein